MANSFFPSNHKSPDERRLLDKLATGYFNAKVLPEGGDVDIRLCGTAGSGHVITGYKYFTREGRPRLFTLWPDDYEKDIGMNFDKSDKATPSYFLACVGFVAKHLKPVVLEFDQVQIQDTIEQTLNREDYTIEPGMPANFYLTISKGKKNGKIVYSVLPTLKALPKGDPHLEAWEKYRDTIWLPALFEGGDPFAGAPSGTSRTEPPIPITTRDEMGADHESVKEAVASGNW